MCFTVRARLQKLQMKDQERIPKVTLREVRNLDAQRLERFLELGSTVLLLLDDRGVGLCKETGV